MGIGFLRKCDPTGQARARFRFNLALDILSLGKKRAGPMPCSEFLMLFALCPRDFDFIRVAAVDRAVGPSSQDLDRMPGVRVVATFPSIASSTVTDPDLLVMTQCSTTAGGVALSRQFD